jgi:hypothetical protein
VPARIDERPVGLLLLCATILKAILSAVVYSHDASDPDLLNNAVLGGLEFVFPIAVGIAAGLRSVRGLLWVVLCPASTLVAFELSGLADEDYGLGGLLGLALAVGEIGVTLAAVGLGRAMATLRRTSR